MKKFKVIAVVMFLTQMGMIPQVYAKSLVIGYLGYWNAGVTVNIEKIPGDLLTPAIYAMINVSEEGECIVSPKDKLNPKGNPTALSQFQLLKLL